MKNKRVFIGWNGDDNKEIAQRISNYLSYKNFSPIVGGEWRQSLTISEEIIHQMNGCDFAIILIEKEIRKNKNGQILSMGMNPNVMMELGYMLHKLSDHNHVRRILINMDPSELPSDLQGCWSKLVEKRTYSTEEEKNDVLSKVAKEIADDFFEYIETVGKTTDKLEYFDQWNENSRDIFHFNGDVRIADKLLFGMQAAIYSGDFDRLYNKLNIIKSELSKKDRFNDYPVVTCAMAVLNVFVVTKRLTCTVTDDQFDMLYNALEFEYEKNLDDELKAWCRIFRYDKLELLHEIYADSQEDVEEKLYYYGIALEYCFNVMKMIENQVQKSLNGKKNHDEHYALLYMSFSTRNISQIYKKLIELEPEKSEEYLEKHAQYCEKSLSYRSKLYMYYKGSRRENLISMDYITQEYILALAEQYKFEQDVKKKMEIKRTVKTIYTSWKERNSIRNMLFEKVTKEASEFLKK